MKKKCTEHEDEWRTKLDSKWLKYLTRQGRGPSAHCLWAHPSSSTAGIPWHRRSCVALGTPAEQSRCLPSSRIFPQTARSYLKWYFEWYGLTHRTHKYCYSRAVPGKGLLAVAGNWSGSASSAASPNVISSMPATLCGAVPLSLPLCLSFLFCSVVLASDPTNHPRRSCWTRMMLPCLTHEIMTS